MRPILGYQDRFQLVRGWGRYSRFPVVALEQASGSTVNCTYLEIPPIEQTYEALLAKPLCTGDLMATPRRRASEC